MLEKVTMAMGRFRSSWTNPERATKGAMGGTGNTAGQRYVDVMFNWATASTALTGMYSGTGTNSTPYAPRARGSLLEIYILVSPQAASSLAQSGYITLTTTSWKPINSITIPFTGFGLATAPQLLGGNLEVTPYVGMNMPVDPSLGIAGSVLYAYSPVTPFITVAGKFSAMG